MEKEKVAQIFVSGNYRSGTSALAGVLWHLGVDMRLDCKENDSKKYYKPHKKDNNSLESYFSFECQSFCSLNNALFKKLGGGSRYTVRSGDWKKEKEVENIDTMILKYFNNRNKQGYYWGVKDPRIVPFMMLYWKYCDNPKFILTKRNDQSLMKSLQNHEGTNDNGYGSVIDTWNESREELKREIPKEYWLELEFEKFLDNPKETVDKIIEFIDYEPTEEQYNNAVAYIDKKLKHF